MNSACLLAANCGVAVLSLVPRVDDSRTFRPTRSRRILDDDVDARIRVRDSIVRGRGRRPKKAKAGGNCAFKRVWTTRRSKGLVCADLRGAQSWSGLSTRARVRNF